MLARALLLTIGVALADDGAAGLASGSSTCEAPLACEVSMDAVKSFDDDDDDGVVGLLQAKAGRRSRAPPHGSDGWDRLLRTDAMVVRSTHRVRNAIIVASVVLLGGGVVASKMGGISAARIGRVENEAAPRLAAIEEKPQTYSAWEAALGLFNISIGTCLLSLPFCLSRTGPIGFLMLVVTGTIMTATAALYGSCMETICKHSPETTNQNWNSISYPAFGKIGLIFTTVLVPMDLFMCLLDCILITGNVLPELLPAGIPASAAIVFGGIIAFFLATVPPGWLPGISMVGGGSTLVLVVCLIATGAAMLMPGSSALLGRHHKVVDTDALVGFVGVFMGAFNIHATLPFFYKKLRDKSEWKMVVGVSMSLSTTFYLLIGLATFYLFGDMTKEVFAHNLGKDGRGHKLYGFVLLRPLCCALLALQQVSMVPAIANALADEIASHSRRVVESVCIVICTFLAVLGNRVLPYILALEGSFIDFPLGILIPMLAYLSLQWEDISLCTKCVIFGVLLLCLAVTLPGLIFDTEVLVGEKKPVDKD